MSEKLIQLSIAAYGQATMRGTTVPSELREFSHLPMVLFDEVPVFDSNRMTREQVEETTERLERMTGRRQASNTFEEVAYYMEAYGRFGLRVKDICDTLSISKRRALVALQKLEADGQVVVTEEKNPRGNGASPRKRYTWAGNQTEYGPEDLWVEAGEGVDANLTDLRISNDDRLGMNQDSGIIHHGTAVGGCRCSCILCQDALLDGLEDEERTAARRAGGTGFTVGLTTRRVRRERWQAEVKAAGGELAAAGGW